MNSEAKSSRPHSLDAAKKNLAAILGLGAVGWLDAAYALWHRQNLFANGLVEKSFCNVNAAVDCDSVAFSSYSAIFGIPTAAYGMFFSALVVVLAVFAYFAAQDNEEEQLAGHAQKLFLLSAAALVPTLALAGISVLKLGTLCLLCLVTYLVNLGIFFFAWKLRGTVRKPAAFDFSAPLAWTSLVLLLLHLLAPKMVNGMVSGQGSVDESTLNLAQATYVAEPIVNFDLTKGAAFGPADAAVTVVEFSDFQCPYCAVSARTVPALLKAYGGRIRYVYKFYPLDNTCNAGLQRQVHPLACEAARIGHCVQQLKGHEAFFGFKENVFAKQATMTKESLWADATAAGAADADLRTCVADPATQAAIVAQVKEGTDAKVEGTPSIYVNGRKLESGPNPQMLTRIIGLYLKE